MNQKKVILASSSPRRRELLEYAGISFIIDPPNIEENMRRKLSARQLVKALALEKTLAVAPRHRNAIVIGADTVVAIDDHIWGKPENGREARFMLKTLSGKTHEVWTGFCIVDTGSGKRTIRAVKTRITLLPFSKRNIDRHIASGEALQGAGSYMIQKGGAALIQRINGDYTNVLGLPLAAVLEELRAFGVK